jgi:hypothetical protein
MITELRVHVLKLDQAFENFINMDTRVASYLAQYIDDLLKKGSFPVFCYVVRPDCSNFAILQG